jgi:hypothetical protein
MSNKAYPYVNLEALFDSSLQLQYAFQGTFDSWMFSVGLTGRSVDRTIVSDEFALLDIAGDPSLLDVEKQRLLFLQPGFVFAYDNTWKPRFSLHATNLRVYNNGATTTSVFGSPAFDWGGGLIGANWIWTT